MSIPIPIRSSSDSVLLNPSSPIHPSQSGSNSTAHFPSPRSSGNAPVRHSSLTHTPTGETSNLSPPQCGPSYLTRNSVVVSPVLETPADFLCVLGKFDALKDFLPHLKVYWDGRQLLEERDAMKVTTLQHLLLFAYTLFPPAGSMSLCELLSLTMRGRRSANEDACMYPIAVALDDTLRKLSKEKLDEAWRGLQVPDENHPLWAAFVGEDWKEGDVVSFVAFSSFSASREVAGDFVGEGRAIFLEVHGGFFCRISPFSAHTAEHEYLARPPTHYRVTSRGQSDPNIVVVEADATHLWSTEDLCKAVSGSVDKPKGTHRISYGVDEPGELTATPTDIAERLFEKPGAFFAVVEASTERTSQLSATARALAAAQPGRAGQEETLTVPVRVSQLPNTTTDGSDEQKKRRVLLAILSAAFADNKDLHQQVVDRVLADDSNPKMSLHIVLDGHDKETAKKDVVKDIIHLICESPSIVVRFCRVFFTITTTPFAGNQLLGPEVASKAMRFRIIGGSGNPSPIRDTRTSRNSRSGYFSPEDDRDVARSAPHYSTSALPDLQERVSQHYGKKYPHFVSVTSASHDHDRGDDLDELSVDRIYVPLSLVEVSQRARSSWGESRGADTIRNSRTSQATGSRWSFRGSSGSVEGRESHRESQQPLEFEALSILEHGFRCSTCRRNQQIQRCSSCERLLVVEGCAGSGKSTLAMQLGREQPSEHFVFVVVAMDTLESFLPPDDEELSMLQILGIALSSHARNASYASGDIFGLKDVRIDLVKELWGNSDIPIAWVLDGFDEMSGNDLRIKWDFLAPLLDRESSFWERRRNDTVIMMSREEKPDTIATLPTMHIVAWGAKDVELYAERFFLNDGEKFKKVNDLVLSPCLARFAQLPIACELACFEIEKADRNSSCAFVCEKAIEQIYRSNESRRVLAATPATKDRHSFKSLGSEEAQNEAAELALVLFERYRFFSRNPKDRDEELERCDSKLFVNIPMRSDVEISLIHSGWLRRIAPNKYQFVDRSFMEYFAVRGLASNFAMLQRLQIDVGYEARQWSLLSLLVSHLMLKYREVGLQEKHTVRSSISHVVSAIAKSFSLHFHEVKRKGLHEVSMSTRLRKQHAKLRDVIGCNLVAEVADMLYRWQEDSLPSPPDGFSFEKLSLRDLDSALMNAIDLGASNTRWLTRSFLSAVPEFYAWMIEPMAKRNALVPLMYVQRRVSGDKALFKKLQECDVYNAALLEAEAAGAKDTAHFLNKHCGAKIQLELAAQLGYPMLLRRELEENSSDDLRLVSLIPNLVRIATNSSRFDAVAEILSVAFKNWPVESEPADVVFIAVAATLNHEVPVCLNNQRLRDEFRQQADIKCPRSTLREIDLSGCASDRVSAPSVVFVVNALEADCLRLDGIAVHQDTLKGLRELRAPSLSLRNTTLDEDCAPLLAAMSRVTELDLSGTKDFGNTDLYEVLEPASTAAPSNLKVLNLSGTAVTHAGVLRSALLLKQLRKLTIPTPSGGPDTVLESHGGGGIAMQVTHLDLRALHESDLDELRNLHVFENLTAIDLSGSKEMKDQHLGFVACIPKLRSINLSGTSVSDPRLLESTDGHALGKLSVPKLTIELPVKLEESSKESPPARQLLLKVRMNAGVTSVELSGHVSDDDLRLFNEAPQIASLKLTGLQNDTHASIGSLLEVLHTVFPNLVELDLSGLAVTDEHLPALVPCRSLQEVDLSNTQVDRPRKMSEGVQDFLASFQLAYAAATGFGAACEFIIKRGTAVDPPVENSVHGYRPRWADDGRKFVVPLPPPTASIESPLPQWSPLFFAVLHRHRQTAETLISAGADVNRLDSNGNSLVHLAAEMGADDFCAQTCLLLLELEGDLKLRNDAGMTPLHIAVCNRHFEICTVLLAKGTDVNTGDSDGASPLHVAARQGDMKLCELLLDFDANVNQPDEAGQTPLFYAARNGHLDVCALLVNANETAAQHQDKRQWSALHFCADVGDTKLCKFLVVELQPKKRAAVNAVTQNGSTPLHLAAEKGHLGVCQVLLDMVTDVNHKDNNGLTALSKASQNGHAAVCEHLRRQGALDANTVAASAAE